jgi:hypothetical protein
MNRTAGFIFAAIVTIVYGLGLALAPAWTNELHGIAGSAATSFVSRLFGASLLGIGVMSWLARDAAESDALSAMIQGTFVFYVIAVIVSLYAVIAGVMNAVGWIPTIILASLAVGSGYLGFVKR